MSHTLFEGEAGLLGGLSNEEDLVKQCPDSFKENNSWSDYASKLFFSGGTIGNWKYKDTEKEKQIKQFSCFKGLLSTFGIPHEDKEAIAGWMLSEMLVEVPKYVPKK